jgi:hypothetical protein
VDGDPLASSVRGVLDSILNKLPNCPEIEAHVDGSRTISPAKKLRAELRQLEEQALTLGAPEEVRNSISELIKAEHSNRWDTSFEPSLDSIKAKVADLRTHHPVEIL